MPRVVITLRPGRTSEMLQTLAAEVTNTIVSTLDVPRERVHVRVQELEAPAESGAALATTEEEGRR